MTSTLKHFIADHRIKFSCEWADSNPNMDAKDEWMRAATHWKVTFRVNGRQMTTYFSQGSAHTSEPTAEDVLDCLASDAASIENANGDFESWASEFGYDTDSRKAERTFLACQKNAQKLENLLSRDSFEQLLWRTERL